jgi:hypothetical protein
MKYKIWELRFHFIEMRINTSKVRLVKSSFGGLRTPESCWSRHFYFYLVSYTSLVHLFLNTLRTFNIHHESKSNNDLLAHKCAHKHNPPHFVSVVSIQRLNNFKHFEQSNHMFNINSVFSNILINFPSDIPLMSR